MHAWKQAYLGGWACHGRCCGLYRHSPYNLEPSHVYCFKKAGKERCQATASGAHCVRAVQVHASCTCVLVQFLYVACVLWACTMLIYAH